MIFRSIQIRNFGRFYGPHRLDLEEGLYVVHGENGLGKTTFLNAVRWALYGKHFDRQGRLVAPAAAINADAAREGDKTFQVTLSIDDAGVPYLLRRTQVVTAGTSPKSELYVERNGVTLSQSAAAQTVSRLLSEEIARFFFFDGEQLQQYESLLFNDDANTKLVKQSIEQILGLPAFDRALEDLEAVQEEFGRRQAALARANSKYETKGLIAEQKATELDSARADLAELLEQQAALLAVVKERDDFLQAYDASLGTLRKIEAVESEVSEMQKQVQLLRDSRGNALRGAWIDVLAAAVAPRLSELDRLIAQEHDDLTDSILRQAKLTDARSALQEGSCPLCSQVLNADATERLRTVTRVDDLLSRGMPSTPDAPLRRALLGSIIPTGQLSDVVDVDSQISHLMSDVTSKRQELSRLRAAINDLPENDVNNAQKDRDAAQQNLGRLHEHIASREVDIRELDQAHRRALAEIRSDSSDGDLARLGNATEIAAGLAAAFEEAKRIFREEVRGQVERDASDAFVRLADEPTFSGLRINENYGLEILNDRGEVVTLPSAGQQQLVALALIAALNRNALRRAPLMMDTPFGRLDPSHRTNVLTFISDFSEQVFLLVHSGEVSDDDLNGVRSRITAELTLVRSGADRTDLAQGSISNV